MWRRIQCGLCVIYPECLCRILDRYVSFGILPLTYYGDIGYNVTKCYVYASEVDSEPSHLMPCVRLNKFTLAELQK